MVNNGSDTSSVETGDAVRTLALGAKQAILRSCSYSYQGEREREEQMIIGACVMLVNLEMVKGNEPITLGGGFIKRFIVNQSQFFMLQGHFSTQISSLMITV